MFSFILLSSLMRIPREVKGDVQIIVCFSRFNASYKFNDPVLEKDHHNGIIKMYEALKREKHTIICTSPLTSLGILMRLDNSIKDDIEQIIIMGGAFGITPYGKGNMGNAEFNIFYDPEAAKIVMEEDINETIVPLDVTMNRELAIKSIPANSYGSPLEDFIHKTTEFMIEEHGTFEMHDPIAVFSFIEPDAFEFVNGEIAVKRDGSTEFIEKRGGKKRIATGINSEAYRKGLVDRIYGGILFIASSLFIVTSSGTIVSLISSSMTILAASGS